MVLVEKIDHSWTLFLDRDGVINEKRENDYVKNWSEFSFINGSLEAISVLSNFFGKIIIVTNQRGVGKGIMSLEDLKFIHERMLNEIKLNSGKIDKIYYCIDVSEYSFFRKPNIGMGNKAKIDYPEIEFNKSIIVGDSISDIEFGEKLGMKKILIGLNEKDYFGIDGIFKSLHEFSNYIEKLDY
jgi:histidinol-phosphate phosphatase family protein